MPSSNIISLNSPAGRLEVPFNRKGIDHLILRPGLGGDAESVFEAVQNSLPQLLAITHKSFNSHGETPSLRQVAKALPTPPQRCYAGLTVSLSS